VNACRVFPAGLARASDSAAQSRMLSLWPATGTAAGSSARRGAPAGTA